MSLEAKIKALVDARVGKAMQPSEQTVLAEYKGTDGQGKGWVVIAGSTESTPITRATVEASPGDTVSVTVGNGQAVMDANISNPSAGVVGVRKAAQTAQEAKGDAEQAIAYSSQAMRAANSAQESADSAGRAASQAWEHADSAGLAASAAQASADNAATAASDAQASADDAQASAGTAQTSADSAQASANSALHGLSEVEQVVGAVEWIASHGTYTNALDAFDPDTVYYVPSASSPTGYAMVDSPTEQGMWSYAPTSDVAIDSGKTYYAQSVSYAYELTQDAEIVEGKTYYAYDSESGEYEAVDEPTAADLPTYYERMESVAYEAVETLIAADLPTYYERSSLYYVLDVSESVQNYIATHLALTDEGLHIFGGAGDYSALLGTDGLDIRNPGGVSVSKYGEDFRVGRADTVHLAGTSEGLAFRTSDGNIAYFGFDGTAWSMYIARAHVRESLRFGNYAWSERANGNMTLKYVEGA